MRIESVRVDAFGGLRNVEVGPGLPGFVVVEGANEAGKSSFFEFVVALLYGFYPASRDRNPWAPWDGTVASGQAVLRLEGGACLEVQRRLLSSPAGTALQGGREDSLRNDTLACAAHVSRGIYRQVFALTLAELATLEGEGWAAVEDRLLGSLGARDVRPAREVAGELETEAGALWRPNRRGNQQVRDLDARRREMAYRRTEVREDERRLREAHRELAELRESLERVRSEREACRGRLARARAVEPLRQELTRLAELEVRAGPVDRLEGLPPDPPRRLEELRHRTREAEERLRQEARNRERLDAAVAAYQEAHARRLEGRHRVEALGARVAAADPERVRLGQLQQEGRDLTRRLETALQPLGLRNGVDEDALLALDLAAVRQATSEILSARETLERHRAAEAVPGSVPVPRLPAAALALGLVAGLVLLGVGVVRNGITAAVLGTAVAAVSGGLLLLARKGSSSRDGGHGERAKAAEARLASARERLTDLLGQGDAGLRLPDDGHGLAALPAALERAQELVRDLAERRRARTELASRLESLDRDARALAEELQVDVPSPDEGPVAVLHHLRTAVAEAEQRRREASEAERALADLSETRSRTEASLASDRSELETLAARLADLAGGEADAGAREAAQRLRARERAEELRRELAERHTPEKLAAARENRAGEGSPDGVGALSAREQELSDRVEALTEQLVRVENEAERLAARETLDALDGELASLEEERARLARERDRLWLLARVVKDADRWVREEHQPEILRRAGALLATLTGGRYDRIVLEGDEGRTFKVKGPALSHSVPVDRPLSTGTREQVYLALRLALLDALDGGGERLPLILDEVLVNWDRERRDRALDALAELAPHRQVFLLTCHRPLADAARERGAHVVRLEGP